MNLREHIEKWLKEHPDASPEQAIWAGAKIEIHLRCNKGR